MIKIYDMIEKAKEAGYDETNAEAKVCQDLILSLISQSQYNRNVTVKGGVVMRSITNNTRRATQDMDLDFIKYSLQDESIDRFINKLNEVGFVSIKRIGRIEELMLMYGKEASNRKQEIDRQHYTIPNQRPKDKHCGKI